MSAPSEAGFLIAKIHQVSGRVFARLLKGGACADINPAQGRILFALRKHGPMNVTALSKATALEPSSLTSMVDRLVTMGLLVRGSTEGDRRAVVVDAAPGSEELDPDYDKVSRQMTSLFYRGFSKTERTAFEAALVRILVNLEEAERGLKA